MVYLAVAGFVLLEDFGVPVPGETILIAGAVYAGAGRLNIVLVAILALLAAVIGDNIGYGIGYFGGRRLVLRWGKYVFITPQRLDKAEDWSRRHGAKIVTVARFIEGLRQANGLVAGTTKMPWKRFAAFNALGAVLWVGVWTTVGYVSGSHIDAVYGVIRRGLIYVVGVILLAIAVRIGVHLYRRKHSGGDHSPGAHSAGDNGRGAAVGTTRAGTTSEPATRPRTGTYRGTGAGATVADADRAAQPPDGTHHAADSGAGGTQHSAHRFGAGRPSENGSTAATADGSPPPALRGPAHHRPDVSGSHRDRRTPPAA